jgi:hypothetical protein
MKSMVLVALAVAIAFVQPAAAQEAKQDFTLVNKTGYELNKVFVSPSKSDDWEEDVLGQDTLANNDSVDIQFHRATKTCKWDLKVIYTVDSSSAVWSDIDLCSVDKITIHYDKDRDATTANFD